MRCENCREETERGPYCDNCKIANLSLEVEKEKSRNNFLKKVVIATVIVVIGLGFVTYSLIV